MDRFAHGASFDARLALRSEPRAQDER